MAPRRPAFPRRLAALGFLALATLAASPALAVGAVDEVLGRVTPDRMAGLLQDMGYRAEILTENGKSRIRTRIGGANVSVAFYACDEGQACANVGLRAYFEDEAKKGAEFANQWNRDQRFSKAYVDRDGDLALEFDVFVRGVTQRTLRSSFDVYEDQLKEFSDELFK